MKKLLFGYAPGGSDPVTSVGLLVLRIGAGLLMLTHGYGKLSNYGEMATQFGDPIGLGSQVSLTLAVFAEFFCSIAVVLGLMTRAAVIPLIVTMLVAVLVVHIADPFGRQELGLLYLTPYIVLLIVGAGRYSLDNAIGKMLSGSKPAQEVAR